MSELPEGWDSFSLGEISSLKTGPFGSSLHKSDYTVGGIPIVNPMHIVKGRIVPADKTTITLETAERLSEFRLRAGDVVIGRRGEMGRCAVVTEVENNWLCGTGSLIIRPEKVIDSEYLQRFLSSPETITRLEDASVGSTMVNLNQRVLLNISVPLPPLNEQKRIAAKLDALLERVDACRARLERVPLLLKRFRQAVLAAATSGQLTEDWREDIGNESSAWDSIEYQLGEIARFIDYRGKTPRKTTSGIPLITAKNIRQGYLSLEPREYIAPEDYEPWMTRGIPQVGDVLITTEAPLGNVVCINWEYKFALAQRAICLRFKREIAIGQYASLVMQAPAFQRELQGEATGSTVAGIKASRLKEISIGFPSLSEQTEIVRRVETLFAYADRLEARSQQARAEVERLTPALLAKAFRGELVPQDPNDEPAAALLARIQAARAESDAKPRARANSKPVSRSEDSAAPVSSATQREEPAAGLVAIAQPDSPPRNQTGATNGHQPAPLDIDEYERETLLATMRDVFQHSVRYDADTAIRTVAHALGYARTGARIHERLKNTLRVAVQRGILCNGAGEYRLDRRSIADYNQDECVAALLASLPRGWTEREDAIRAATRYLGFRRTGSAIQDAFKSAINGAIRRRLLEYDKDLIRKKS